MSKDNQVSRILWYEAIGFLAIIIFSWINELTNIAQIFGHSAYVANWQEAILETVIVGLIATPVMIFTHRLMRKINHLEKLLRVCSWCRKTEVDGKWIPIEELMIQKYKTKTSHGMCPDCAEKMSSDIKRSRS